MDQHLRILSILFYIMGGLGLLAAVVVLLTGGAAMMSGVAAHGDDRGAALAGGGCVTIVAIFIAIMSIPSIVCGWAIANRKPWARILAIVLGVLSLPSVPIGTAIGAYTLYVMFQDETKRIFGGSVVPATNYVPPPPPPPPAV